jgi:lipopolysaccharide biosynthesis glycosyltransferase
MYYFCTYFDKNYLDKGLALYHSLSVHCQPFKLWILCLDDEVYRKLNGMKLPSVTLISIAGFEWEDTKLAEAKKNRSLIEYYFTCTPSLILKVMETNREIDILTYLDADLYFFSSIEPLYKEMVGYSILIVEHRFPPHLHHLEKYGIYNVGLLSFRNDRNAMVCLQWWRDRCLEWCYDRLEDGKFADQKYLNDWLERFSLVRVLKGLE